ncbi:hypothetical protein [Rhizobium sp. OAE497]|uniref:hypothetical protein n=1 Tax=Rhizobium sp. OAE497 TaxID=2663796 RepID=UPI0018F37C5E
MTTVKIEPAKRSHIGDIAARMRKADAAEAFAASRRLPSQALDFALCNSTAAWTVLIKGKPAAMFGVGDVGGPASIGAPWLLGTDAVEWNFRPLLRQSISFREQLISSYDTLIGFVDARNTLSIRWLEWLGLTSRFPVTHGGQEFRMFQSRAANV